MLEEDLVLIFSANENFVDLVLTYNLEIDYDGAEEETNDRSDTTSDSLQVQQEGEGCAREDKEEGGGPPQAGLSTPVVEVQDGQAGGDSEEDECEAAPDCPVRTLFD